MSFVVTSLLALNALSLRSRYHLAVSGLSSVLIALATDILARSLTSSFSLSFRLIYSGFSRWYL